jgi:hypothetical protein
VQSPMSGTGVLDSIEHRLDAIIRHGWKNREADKPFPERYDGWKILGSPTVCLLVLGRRCQGPQRTEKPIPDLKQLHAVLVVRIDVGFESCIGIIWKAAPIVSASVSGTAFTLRSPESDTKKATDSGQDQT